MAPVTPLCPTQATLGSEGSSWPCLALMLPGFPAGSIPACLTPGSSDLCPTLQSGAPGNLRLSSDS